jgi:hypothetical protein
MLIVLKGIQSSYGRSYTRSKKLSTSVSFPRRFCSQSLKWLHERSFSKSRWKTK